MGPTFGFSFGPSPILALYSSVSLRNLFLSSSTIPVYFWKILMSLRWRGRKLENLFLGRRQLLPFPRHLINK